MIELTDQQMQLLSERGETPTNVVHSKSGAVYVLVLKEVFERMVDPPYDAGSWTDEERELLAAEVDAMLDDNMAIEDDAP